jgi:hypothetical protein
MLLLPTIPSPPLDEPTLKYQKTLIFFSPAALTMSSTIAMTDMWPNTVVFDLDVDKVTSQDQNWDHDGIPNFVQISETGRVPSSPRPPQAPVWILVVRGITIALTVLTLIGLAVGIREEQNLLYPSVPGSSSCLPPLIAVRKALERLLYGLAWKLICRRLRFPSF